MAVKMERDNTCEAVFPLFVTCDPFAVAEILVLLPLSVGLCFSQVLVN